ncbi:MAG: hypothetical protein RSD17_00815, partial [Oscillospiraceae bacterium]
NEIEVAEQMLQQDTVVCEFCGQVLIDRECNCYESHEAERKKKNIQKALDITLPTLTDEVSCTKFEFLPIYDEHLLKLLRQMVLDVGNEVIEKATVKVDEDTVFTIQNKTIFIEISRKENTSKVVKLGG